jgi:hypothetical protein
MKKNPHSMAPIIKQEVLEVACLMVQCINYLILKRLKIPRRIAAPKPLLIKKMKGKGLAFAANYWNRTEDDWSKVIFSDESTFCCLRATKSCVRRPTRLDYFDTLYRVKIIKHPSMMVWECFAGNGRRGGIYFSPPPKKNNELCLLSGGPEGPCWTGRTAVAAFAFPPGWGTCHALKAMKAFLDQQDFEIMDWLGNSPDPNPIENFWNHMKNKLKDVDISSLPKLKDALLKLWPRTSSMSNWLPSVP